MPRFDGLPTPKLGELTAYFLGPGFGESTVVALPDGKFLVVDACFEDGKNLTLDLLTSFLGAGQIDLLALTHPDLDHLRGASSLLPLTVRLWPWPHHGSIRRLAAMASKRAGGKRYQELQLLLEELGKCIAKGLRVGQGGVGKPDWPEDAAPYRVISLGPCSYDWESAGLEVDRLVEADPKASWLATRRLLEGVLTAGVTGDRPNRLSKAVVIQWGGHKLLLAGDVENGGAPQSGWKGILAELAPVGAEPDRRDWVRDLTLVKVAHHGSAGAYSVDAWNLHCTTGKVQHAALAPFNRGDVTGGTNPPSQGTLAALRGRVDELVLTAPAGAAATRAVAAGWSVAACPRAAGSASIAALTLRSDGTGSWCLAGSANLYR